MLIRSQVMYKKRKEKEKGNETLKQLMKSTDNNEVIELLRKHKMCIRDSLIGIVIGHHYHIGTRLAGAVRAVRAERGLLCEVAFGTKWAVNFVGRHLIDVYKRQPITAEMYMQRIYMETDMEQT